VGGALLPGQLAFQTPLGAVGVDHPGQVPARCGELGGVQTRRVVEQHPLPAPPDQVTGRQPVQAADDHVDLLG
jgi:hypothetical protein